MAWIFTRSKLVFEESGIKIYHLFSSEYLENDKLITLLAELNSQAFDQVEPPSKEDTLRRLKLTNSVLIAVEHDSPVGFATFRFLSCGKYSAIYQSRGILPRARRQGLGRRFSQIGIELYLPEILTGRTQHPASILSLMQLKEIDVLYPIEKLYSEDKAIQAALKDLVEQKGGVGKVNLETGLQKHAYFVGRLGKYKVDLTHPEIAKIEKKFLQFGLERDNGDTIYYMGKLKRK